MKIIVIEGLDKAGKHTQVMRLVKYLLNKGLHVSSTDFHRYDSPTGQLIRKWLYKEYDVDRATIELIMSADKQAQQSWFKSLELHGVDFLILDRYVGSQTCYAIASGLDKEWVFSLQGLLIKPDLEIFIDISPLESMSRKGKHGENDRFESDLQLLGKIRSEYHSYFNFEGCYSVEDSDNFGSRVILPDCDTVSVDDLHRNIVSTVEKNLDVSLCSTSI